MADAAASPPPHANLPLMAPLPLPGLYPMNAETKAHHEASKG